MVPLRAIVVGLGKRGRQWLNLMGRCRDVEAVAGVDPDPGASNAARRWLGGPQRRLFPTLPMALRNCQAEAALVCTPAAAHREPVLECLEAGLAVLVEKPLAWTAAEARHMTNRAAELRRPLIVAQNYRYALPARTLRKAVSEGLVGRVGFCQCASHQHPRHAGTDYLAMPCAQLDMAVHHFDMLRWILDSDVESVQARAFNPPWSPYAHGAGIHAVLAFADGVTASYVGSWASPQASFELSMAGPGGALLCSGKRVRYRRPQGRLWRRVPAPKLHALDRMKAPWGGMHALLEELRAALDGDGQTPNRAEANLKTLGIALACILSDRERREVTVTEALEG